jgi:hypothetical protein
LLIIHRVGINEEETQPSPIQTVVASQKMDSYMAQAANNPHRIFFNIWLYRVVSTTALQYMTEINHDKRLSEVLSHAKCPRCNSNDKEAIASVGNNYNLGCKHCWYEDFQKIFPDNA